MSFDAATVTVDDAANLTGAQARLVAEHYGLPELPKSAKVADLRAFAATAIQAHTPAGALPGAPDDDVPITLEAPSATVVPTESRFSTIVRLADYVSKSGLCPDVLRKKPEDIGVIMLMANDLGVPLMAAVNQFYVVKGKVGMEAKLMRSLVRRDGHSIAPVESNDPWFRQVVHGKRADNGDEDEFEYTLDDALDQKLILRWERTDDGRVKVTPADGRAPWGTIPRTMLRNRATSALCRDLFPDCLAGVTYTPDDLGDFDTIDEAGAPGAPRDDEKPLTDAEQRKSLEARLAALDPELAKEVADQWKSRHLPPLRSTKGARLISGAALGQAIRLVAAAEEKQIARDEEHDEAEVLACVLCGDETGPFEESTDGDSDAVRCQDRTACMARVSEIAATAATRPQEPSEEPAAPGGPETSQEPRDGATASEMCREPGGCPNIAVADGYCADHAPM